MLKIRFNPDEIRVSRPIAPGKYGFELKKVKEGITAKKEKKYTWTFEGITGAANGASLSKTYTEEYIEYMIALLENGFGLEMDAEDGSDVDVESLYGRKLWIVTDIGTWGGSQRTEMKGFQRWEEGGEEETKALAETTAPVSQ
jgi:hypothetical protein